MFIRYPSRQRDVPIRLIIPNLLTTMGLCSGLVSIHFTLKPVATAAATTVGSAVESGPDFDRAVGAIMIAAVFDMLDGRAARMLHASSKFGTVLDSLSDFLCFGVAPAVLMHQWILKRPDLQPIGKPTEAFVLAAILLFALCSALRLARFTAAAEPPKTDASGNAIKPSPLASKFFVGMPTPAAAAAVLIPVMLKESKIVGEADISAIAIVCYTIAIAWLMVSRQPMFSFKKLRISRPLVVPLMLAVGLWFVLAAKDFWLAIAAIAGAYLLTLPLSLWSYHKTVKQMTVASAAAEQTGE
jgi:CDP-diacylglycerol--serine O-phosphatidyltransferase